MKRIGLLLLLLAALVVPAPAAEAGLVTGDIIKVVSSNGTTGGGAFWIDGPGTMDFWSFCLERDEFISVGHSYAVKLDTVAVYGGENSNTFDPLDPKTAYLYAMFTLGALGTLDTAHIDGLQLAIWRIEEELTSTYFTKSGTIYQMGNSTTRGYADAYIASAANASGLYGVQVMQLWNSCDARGNCSGPAQDMLYRVPDGGATLMLLGGALIGLGAIRRKLGL